MSRGWLILVAVILGVVYAAGDEFHQSFVPGRFAHVLDWTADVAGLLVGVLIAVLFLEKRPNSTVRKSEQG